MTSQAKSMPFIKNLASSDRKTRTAALESLRTFLSAKHISSSLSTLDILKLWKGLFYALWMCDRPLPQQALCRDLADLIWILPEPAVIPWLTGFWATMAREWTTGIDVLRMEKFLLLVRRMFGSSLVWTQVRETKKAKSPKKRSASGETASAANPSPNPRFDKNRADQILLLLANWPFRTDEDRREEEEQDELMPELVPVGLKLHALDIWVDEAEKAGILEAGEKEEDAKKSADDTLSGSELLQRLNQLVDNLRSKTLSKAVRVRSKDSLADERLPWNQKEAGENEEGGDDDDEWGGLD
ncbi:hypothetical protein VP1G_08866 [Cytospora mali]|uniref:Ribosomal RNA-processing protein 1 n=1 Tax=Cytospora mali TaxID=578113 RepID=A0A194VCL5_CYTMA|nr:hypothetical protein VP1G_08866 [Valsa mali var. pyri (nom. inval.)]